MKPCISHQMLKQNKCLRFHRLGRKLKTFWDITNKLLAWKLSLITMHSWGWWDCISASSGDLEFSPTFMTIQLTVVKTFQYGPKWWTIRPTGQETSSETLNNHTVTNQSFNPKETDLKAWCPLMHSHINLLGQKEMWIKTLHTIKDAFIPWAGQ